jgi:hypothetical protein
MGKFISEDPQLSKTLASISMYIGTLFLLAHSNYQKVAKIGKERR